MDYNYIITHEAWGQGQIRPAVENLGGVWMNFETAKILVVDDEEIFTSILEHTLKPVYTVFTANSGRQAIEMAQELRPDLILLDVLMPDISGFDVFAELRKIHVTQNIPVIFITGLDNTDDEEIGFFLGAVDYITKPFSNPIVMARVRTHVEIIKHIRTIEQMCMIDALTNLPNRRGFDNRLELEWGRAIRSQEPLSLLFIDMDKFKHYNDTYGHPFGDLLIQTVAGIFGQTFKRSTDFASRWGGDEFAVLLPDTDYSGACIIAEEIRANVANKVIPSADGKNVTMTISIGLSSAIPTDGYTMEDFLAETDKKLYTAKKSGRNRLAFRAGPDVDDGQEPQEEVKAEASEARPESGVDVPERTAFMTHIGSISDLDVERAVVALGGSEALYEKIIRLFLRMVPQNVEQMESSLFSDNDLHAFGIKIHGMKGSLNQIGYRGLAKLAENMEEAAKRDDRQYCDEHYGNFKEQLLSLENQLNTVFSQEDEAEGSGEKEKHDDLNNFREILEKAKTAAEDYDNDMAAELLSPLLKRNFGGEADKLISDAVSELEQFQARKAVEYILELEQKYTSS